MSPEIVALLTSMQAAIQDMDAKLTAVHAELRSKPAHSPTVTRAWYSVEEVAGMLDRRPYTVREWCRNGQINAAKRAERRGCTALWSISAEEVERYKNEGLLPGDRERNNLN